MFLVSARMLIKLSFLVFRYCNLMMICPNKFMKKINICSYFLKNDNYDLLRIKYSKTFTILYSIYRLYFMMFSNRVYINNEFIFLKKHEKNI